jgi:deoxyribonuclease V
MNIVHLHRWDVPPADAIRIQNDLRARVEQTPFVGPLQTVAGVDVGVHDNMARAAVVVLRFPELTILEKVIVDMPATFPYVPGLLAFRECPAVLSAFEKLDCTPDLVIVDGQGLAHPRRFGIACHLGVVLDRPTIGCAKSRLVGTHEDLGTGAGSWVNLSDEGEVIGAVLRSKDGASPLYVSIGHEVDLETAVRHVLACCRGYRLPETTRQAHMAASQRTELSSVVERSLF